MNITLSHFSWSCVVYQEEDESAPVSRSGQTLDDNKLPLEHLKSKR